MTISSNVLSPVTLALATAMLLGIAINIAQHGLRSVSTLAGAAVANLSGAALFWMAVPFQWSSAGVSAGPLAVFVLVGLFFPATVTLLMLASNRRMGASITASISGTTPLFVYSGAIVFLGEALVPQGLLGTLAIAAGIVTLAWRAAGVVPGYASWVLLLPIGAALIRALAQLLTKYGLTLWPNAFAAIVIAYTASAGVVWTLVWVRREPIPWNNALRWFVLSGCMNALGVLAMFAAFRDGEATVVAPIVATAPLFTLAVSALLAGDESLSPRALLGVALTVLGVVLIVLR